MIKANREAAECGGRATLLLLEQGKSLFRLLPVARGAALDASRSSFAWARKKANIVEVRHMTVPYAKTSVTLDKMALASPNLDPGAL
jgi:hypothetical protein